MARHLIGIFILILHGIHQLHSAKSDLSSENPSSSPNYYNSQKNIRQNCRHDDVLGNADKPTRSQGNLKPAALTIVNNIRIVINNNETFYSSKNQNDCVNNDICDVNISTRRDQVGNIITNVQLSVITRTNDIKVDDIPIIDGTRGTSFQVPSNYPNYPNFAHNNVPQIHRHGTSHFQPSFGMVPKPPTDPYYVYNTQGRDTWMMTSRDIVDDKIEPPLSKMNEQ